MYILEKIEKIDNIINESGVRNIREIAKQYKEATIYFHEDSDGVTSALGLKAYLKNYGIKTIAAHAINYGGKEYAIPVAKKGTLNVMVDFAHGKPIMNIHTDHHGAPEEHKGFSGTASTNFVTTPSNLEFISMTLSPNDLFPPEDVKIISTVDTADFARMDVTPDEVMRATFEVDKTLDVSKNRMAMGLVVNKLLLTYKTKPGFLSTLVMTANPSLLSMYNIIKNLAKAAGYKAPEQIKIDTAAYVSQQRGKATDGGSVSDVMTLKGGQSVMVGTTVAQQGGGSMGGGKQYDRYVPFKIHPDADYYTVVWAMGLIQLSKNPFKKGKSPIHLGDLVMKKIMPKFKSKLGKMVTLDTIKYIFERDAKSGDMGFTFSDLLALFEKQLKGLSGSEKWEGMIKDITNKPYSTLSLKQRDILKKVSISVWDIIMTQSGGHKDITNLSGFNFLGKGYTDLMREVQTEIVKEMKDKRLVD